MDRSPGPKLRELRPVPPEYFLPFNEWRRLRRRGYAAQQLGHFEVCGALLAGPSGVLRLEFLRNLADGPAKFLVSSEDLGRAGAEAMKCGFRMVGTFHSHPVSEATPYRRDRRSIGCGEHMLIYDVCGIDARLWLKSGLGTGARMREVSLGIERTPGVLGFAPKTCPPFRTRSVVWYQHQNQKKRDTSSPGHGQV